MNTAAGLGLFLLGSFALIVFAIRTPTVQYYTGGIVIALFIAGLFFAFGNTIRQTNKMKNTPLSPSSQESVEQGPTTNARADAPIEAQKEQEPDANKPAQNAPPPSSSS